MKELKGFVEDEIHAAVTDIAHAESKIAGKRVSMSKVTSRFIQQGVARWRKEHETEAVEK